jgi:ABC-type glycerol-3-phosphate transport system permease component
MAQAGRITAETASLAVPKETALRPDAFLKHAVLLFAVFIALVPTIYMIMTALKSDDEYTFNKIGFPHALVLDHFDIVLFQSPFFQWMGNSAILAGGSVLLSTVVSCLGSYAIARMQFRGRQLLFSISVALMAIPPVVMVVPLFVLYTRLDLISTYQGAILIYAGLITPFSVYLLTTFFRTLPKELFEAARIDGAGDWRIFAAIVLPSLTPILVTLATFAFLASWSDFLWPLIILNDTDMQTLPVALANLSREHVQDFELMMAGAVVTLAPVLLLFLALQRYYLGGLLAGSVKG